ncbi:leucine-rich repeat domain-containing protein [Chaetoceros tenuissimus]|uniref:Leucine-rich repeat domain-containing protein n=1 Tax=Chaetoceros tenuissimus TaxID=426638 RepID=A0AAD3D1K0_9STRA|nr:leucine-rich repeat domain-containing protein [Chaetoceros tenuissimus]
MYKGKKTYFYNGEILWEGRGRAGRTLIYDDEERKSWEVIIVLPGVEVIPERTFRLCTNVKKVIMHEDVKRIEFDAFVQCFKLISVKLSRNLEYIGVCAFWSCSSLTSIFIPQSCREIDRWAFRYCRQLLILGMPQNIQIRDYAFGNTLLMTKLPFSFAVDEDENFSPEDEAIAIQWVKTINDENAFALHRACSSFNPLLEIIHT